MTLDELKKHLEKESSCYVKYVKTADKYLFSLTQDKLEFIEIANGEEIKSCGFLNIRPKVMNFTGSSDTPPTKKDNEFLSEELGQEGSMY